MRRRMFVATIATGAVGTAGCLGFVTGEEAYEQAASPVRIDDTVLDDTGYRLDETYEDVIEQNFEVAGVARSVKAVNRVAQYHRGLELPFLGTIEAAVFAVVATPAFEIAGQTFNPVGDMSNEELAGMIQDEYEELIVGDEVAVSTVETLGDAMNLSQFEASAVLRGVDLDVYAHVGTVRAGEDFVVVVGVHPRRFPDEQAVVRQLVGGLIHGA